MLLTGGGKAGLYDIDKFPIEIDIASVLTALVRSVVVQIPVALGTTICAFIKWVTMVVTCAGVRTTDAAGETTGDRGAWAMTSLPYQRELPNGLLYDRKICRWSKDNVGGIDVVGHWHRGDGQLVLIQNVNGGEGKSLRRFGSEG